MKVKYAIGNKKKTTQRQPLFPKNYIEITYFLFSYIFLAPYAPPAIRRRLNPPSIGVAGGAPCANAGLANSKIAGSIVAIFMMLLFISLLVIIS